MFFSKISTDYCNCSHILDILGILLRFVTAKFFIRTLVLVSVSKRKKIIQSLALPLLLLIIEC